MSEAVTQAIGTRRFGVELEFHFDKGGAYDRYGHREIAERVLRREGLYDKGWNNIGVDGSGCEVRSPILRGAGGLRQLRTVVELLVEAGGVTNSSDGLHVHHDAPEFVKDKLLTEYLVESWKNNEKVIDKFVATRRRNSGACSKWHPRELDELKAFQLSAYHRRGDVPWAAIGPRGAINLGSLREHGSIEIRLHEGTLNWPDIEAWIIFGQRFLDSVVERKALLRAVKRELTLLNELNVPPEIRKRLLAKARRHTRNPVKRVAGR